MKIEAAEFEQLVLQAMQQEGVARMRPVVEKELLHYDILHCLDQAGVLEGLVFQGGTLLRLCYGANRFSEDLDFVGGYDFNSKNLSEIKEVVKSYIGQRYSLEVQVKEPKELKKEPEYAELNIDKWQIAITTAPARKGMAKQRIKLEVANIPAYSKTPLPLRKNYSFLPDGYEDTLIYAETLDEVLADKIISLVATKKYIRYRDVWDLAWLQQQGAQLNMGWVRNKILDYRLNAFDDLLNNRIGSLDAILGSQDFINEMMRFIPTDVYQRTLGQEKFRQYLQQTLQSLLQKTQGQLYGVQEISPVYLM